MDNLEEELESFFSRPGKDIKDYNFPNDLGNVIKTCSQLLVSFYKQSVECEN